MLARSEFIVKTLSIRCISAARTPPKSSEGTQIEKVPSQNQFRLKFNGNYGTVDYESYNNTYVLTHTELPDESMGKGLGRILAEKTFQYIINEKKRIILNCDYLQKFYEKNKDKYKAYVDE